MLLNSGKKDFVVLVCSTCNTLNKLRVGREKKKTYIVFRQEIIKVMS